MFTDQRSKLWDHCHTHIQRHIKVKGTASPYDGNLLYWSQRLSNHYMLSGTLSILLRKQQGKCKWCGLLFKDEDRVEINHITPRIFGWWGIKRLAASFAVAARDNGFGPRGPYRGASGRALEAISAGRVLATVER